MQPVATPGVVLTKEEKQFSDYRRVGSIAGVYPIASQQNADLSRKVRELEAKLDRIGEMLECADTINGMFSDGRTFQLARTVRQSWLATVNGNMTAKTQFVSAMQAFAALEDK